ncbi:MAG TPA: 5-(carboxyamino)imidazole ribonucleotide synthase [Gemmatales bacterium]|nr:5-(carboxyamino)imidazole ribonucleotide synthase [Gemmatales bacterium]
MNIGILGGGQLGRMIALAGYPLGFRFRCFDPSREAVGGHVMPLTVGSFQDIQALGRFAEGLDLLTYEFENIPLWGAEFLASQVEMHPSPIALAMSQDRIEEKTFFHSMSIPTAPFAAIETREEYDLAIETIGLPAVLKTCRLGYDGKGQYVIQTKEGVEAAWNKLQGVPLILEGFVKFDREVSLLSVRSTTGETRFYPLVQNFHQDGILQRSLAPAPDLTPELQTLAEIYATRALDALGYAGVLAIEFFQKDNKLIVNEMAPRVHNSGHWTIEGAVTSQFENHVRAITGLPLGSTELIGQVGMINLLGKVPDRSTVLSTQDSGLSTYLHIYGKKTLPGRKLGHITFVAHGAKDRDEAVNSYQNAINESLAIGHERL